MKWDIKGIPHKGWYNTSVYDSKLEYDDHHTCDMCKKESIRYVHVMEHDEFEGEMHVGCQCAEKMSDTYKDGKANEKKLRNRSSRLDTFLSKTWNTNRNGNKVIKLKGTNITIFKKSNGFSGVYDGNFTKTFSTEDEVKKELFKMID